VTPWGCARRLIDSCSCVEQDASISKAAAVKRATDLRLTRLQRGGLLGEYFNSGNFTALLSRSAGIDVAPTLPGFAAIFNTADARVILSALQAVTDVRVISSPQVLALTNQPALLQVGDSRG